MEQTLQLREIGSVLSNEATAPETLDGGKLQSYMVKLLLRTW